jgi:L-aspartate oxidase
MAGSLRRLPVFHADVLVVGSGAAGLSAALAAADEGAHVMVLSKGGLAETNTRWAQGGIAAAVAPGDDPELHADDTMRLGYGLSDLELVRDITDAAPQAMDWLIQSGMLFDREPDGALQLGREGGHRAPRILHCGGTATGKELQRVLLARVRQHERIDLYPDTGAIELLKDAEGAVRGLVAFAHARGAPEPAVFEAGAVLLATGGGGQIYRETTNPQLATGDGVAMALRAGADLRDLEFVQFHPTILYLAGAARFLISEVTRGAGAVLRDRDGTAFLADAHPDADLAPRDVVSRAIFRRMVEHGDTHVGLDMSGVPDAARRFPALARIGSEFGIDIARDPVPVRPAVHYFVGGVVADLEGRTSLAGLWAAGECASTGFHGANRMGSNSLLEGLVHGRRAGAAAARESRRAMRRPLHPATGGARPPHPGAELNLRDMTYSLKSLMWRQVGLERDAQGLSDALERLDTWAGYLARLGPFTPEGVEVLNMVHVAQAVAASALFREESRGAHFRVDHPSTDPKWHLHTLYARGGDAAQVRVQPLGIVEAAPRR